MIDISKDFETELNWKDIELSPSVDEIHNYDLVESSSAKIPVMKKWTLREDEARFKSSRMDSPYYKQVYKEKKRGVENNFVEKLDLLEEKNWKYTVPEDIAKEYALLVNQDNPNYEEIREVLKKIIGFVKDSFGEDDFYEDGLLEDLEYADFETEEDVNYYINEMYDVLDNYNVWMEPASAFEESKMKESTWTVEIYNSRTGKTIEKKSGFGSDYAACEYGDHTLEDLEEQGIEADYDTFQESKIKEFKPGDLVSVVSDYNEAIPGYKVIKKVPQEEIPGYFEKSLDDYWEVEKISGFGKGERSVEWGQRILKEATNRYAALFKRFLKGVGFDKTGPFAEKDTPYSDKGFEWESQSSKLKCIFDPETGSWYVKWLDYDDPEYNIKERGRGFNNLVQFFFDLPGSIMANYSDEPAEYYFEEDFEDLDEAKMNESQDIKEDYLNAFSAFIDSSLSQKKREEAVADVNFYKDMLIKANPSLKGKSNLQIAQWCKTGKLKEAKLREAEEEGDRKIPLRDNNVSGVIDSVLGQMSDGYWENTSAYDKYWKFAWVDLKNNVLEIDKDSVKYTKRPEWSPRYGQVYRTISTPNAFANMSEDAIKRYFAQKAKFLIKEEGLEWSRDNQEKTDWMDKRDTAGNRAPITVAEVYSAYDWLMGRDRGNISESSQMKESHDSSVLDAETVREILEKLFLKTKDIFKDEVESSELKVSVNPNTSDVSLYEIAKFKGSEWPIITTIEYDADTGEYEWKSEAKYPKNYDGRNGVPYMAEGYGEGLGQLLEDLADEIGLRGVEEYASLDPNYQGKYVESLVHDTLDGATDDLNQAKKANYYLDTTGVEDNINHAQGAIRKVKAMTESEGTPKITGTWKDILEGLREEGFEVSEYYDAKPSQWLTLRKDGREYEAEVTKYSDGSYELMKYNIAILPEGR